jgi:hypothetical protein
MFLLGFELIGHQPFDISLTFQKFKNYNLGLLPYHNSYDIVSKDLDGALFKVNAAIYNAKPQIIVADW